MGLARLDFDSFLSLPWTRRCPVASACPGGPTLTCAPGLAGAFCVECAQGAVRAQVTVETMIIKKYYTQLFP